MSAQFVLFSLILRHVALTQEGLYSGLGGLISTSSIFYFTRQMIPFLFVNAAAFVSSFISTGKGSATIVLSVKNCPKLNLQGIFLYYLNDLLRLCV